MSAEPPAYDSTSVAQSPKKGGPLSGGAGLLLVVVLLGGAAALLYKTYWNAAADVPVESMRRYMCTGDANVFMYALKKGESPPVTCPACKKANGYPCEACYWTKDGGTKDTPTYVILNRHLGKNGDTICPDCGRVVVGHNPDPRKPGQRAEAPSAPGGPVTSQPAPAAPKGDRDR